MKIGTVVNAIWYEKKEGVRFGKIPVKSPGKIVKSNSKTVVVERLSDGLQKKMNLERISRYRNR